MRTALSIAGSDSCGGAGIQADIKTMMMNGVYAMSAITALTAQNTTGVRGIQEVAPAFLIDQIDAVFEDIFPDAVKIGMVSSAELIQAIASRLRHFKAKNIVVDPVMAATSGSPLIKTDAVAMLMNALFPLAAVVTPNIPEGEILSGMSISCKEDMINAAKAIHEAHGCAVLLKGGFGQVKTLLKELFPDVTDEELKRAKMKEVLAVLVQVLKYGFSEMAASGNAKN